MLRWPRAFPLHLALILSTLAGWAESPKIGEPFPEIQGTSIDREEVSLASFKGKPVLVDFWATWCGPCLAEMPNLRRIYRKFHDLGFEIIGISLDQNPEELSAYLQENNLPWPVLNAPGGWRSKWAEAFSVDSIPATFLIDPDGTLASKTAQGSRLVEWIRHLLDPEYPLAPDVEEEFLMWEESTGEKREAAQARILKWAGSPAMVDEMNVAIWTELLQPFLSEVEVSFLSAGAQRLVEAHPRKNYLDTCAYALYRAGKIPEAAQMQAEAVQAVTLEEVSSDYGWLLEARLALYLARAGALPEANRVFTATLARRGKAAEPFSERIDWLAEAADLLDRTYEEPWESESGIDQMFYYARFEGDRKRVRKRYESILESLEEDERSAYALAFGRVRWPEPLRESLSGLETLPLDIEVRDATGGADLVRIKKVGPGGDIALLLDVPSSLEAGEAGKGTLVFQASHLATATRETSLRGGEVMDLGELELAVSE